MFFMLFYAIFLINALHFLFWIPIQIRILFFKLILDLNTSRFHVGSGSNSDLGIGYIETNSWLHPKSDPISSPASMKEIIKGSPTFWVFA